MQTWKDESCMWRWSWFQNFRRILRSCVLPQYGTTWRQEGNIFALKNSSLQKSPVTVCNEDLNRGFLSQYIFHLRSLGLISDSVHISNPVWTFSNLSILQQCWHSTNWSPTGIPSTLNFGRKRETSCCQLCNVDAGATTRNGPQIFCA